MKEKSIHQLLPKKRKTCWGKQIHWVSPACLSEAFGRSSLLNPRRPICDVKTGSSIPCNLQAAAQCADPSKDFYCVNDLTIGLKFNN